MHKLFRLTCFWMAISSRTLNHQLRISICAALNRILKLYGHRRCGQGSCRSIQTEREVLSQSNEIAKLPPIPPALQNFQFLHFVNLAQLEEESCLESRQLLRENQSPLKTPRLFSTETKIKIKKLKKNNSRLYLISV